MARQEIILGTPPNGLGGDPPRTASIKINAMTKELYEKVESLGSTGDVVPIEKGGTGGTTPELARSGLGLGSVSTENVVPIEKGGTGGTTPEQARSGLGLGSAAVANLVGTVAGGAIIEQGSNAKGNFTKFADGTLITWGSQLFNVQTLAGQGAGFNATDQPANFVPGSFRSAVFFNFFGGANRGAPLLYGSMQYYSNGLNNIYVGINMGFSPSAVHPSFLYGPLTSQSHEISYQTIGRWK